MLKQKHRVTPHKTIAKKKKTKHTIKRSLTTKRPTSLHALPKRRFVSIASYENPFDTKAVGTGLDYKLFFFNKGHVSDDLHTAVSPWHDIPLIHSRNAETGDIIFNFVCEIPKDTTAKYEIHTKSSGNPIKQDVKNGQLRHFKYGKIPFNYGALPQTWEDPRHIDPGMKLGGDNDPVDIVEISPAPLKHGFVYPVKILGALALIDEGEVDWKLLAIDANSPIAAKLKDAHHIDAFLPSVETKLKDWFKNYKTAEGKEPNQFGHEGKLLHKELAMRVINETHRSWANLCTKGDDTLAVKPLPEGFVIEKM